MVLSSIDVGRIKERSALVQEINELVGVWEIQIDSCPVRLKIKVLKTSTVPSAPYMGVANYEIKNPQQSDGYRSLNNKSTIHDAFQDALLGFLTYYKLDMMKDTKFILVENW